MTVNFKFWVVLCLLSWVVVNTAAQKISLSSCKSCCEEFFTGAPLGSESACKTGCDVNNGNPCIAIPDSPTCATGTEFRNNGVVDGQFCVDGSLDISFAPTKSPTPPTQSPTKNPTFAPTPGSDPSGANFGMVAGAGGVVVVILGALVFVLRRRTKPKEMKTLVNKKPTIYDKLSDPNANSKDGSEPGTLSKLMGDSRTNSKLTGKPSVLTASTGSKLRKTVRPPGQPPRNLGEQQRLSLQHLLHANALDPNKPKPQFEVIFDFEAEQDDELNVLAGDVVQGVNRVNEEWWNVRLDRTGRVGMVPVDFMREIVPELELGEAESQTLVPRQNSANDIF